MSASSGTLNPAQPGVTHPTTTTEQRLRAGEFSRAQVAGLFLSISLLIGLSFAARNIIGFVYAGGSYNSLVYSAQSIRQVPPPHYDFRPDDAAWDETRAYARWTQEILRGEFLGATSESFQPFVVEPLPESRFWLRDRSGPALLALLSKFTGSVPSAFAWADFLLPFGAALSIFWLCWVLRPSIYFALTCTSLVCFFSWADLLKFALLLRGSDDFTSSLLRTPYPQLSLILFAAFLASLVTLTRRISKARVALFAVILTLNFYTYFYSWVYACCWIVATIAVLGAQYLSDNARDAQEKKKILAIAFAFGCALLVSLPVWYGVLTKTQATLDSFTRLQGQIARLPNLRYGAFLLVAPLFLRTRLDRRVRTFALSFLLASVLVMNQQIFTATTLQPGHWSGYFIQPIFWIVLLDVAWSFLPERSSALVKNSAWAILFLGVIFNTVKLAKCASVAQDYNRGDPELTQVIDALAAPQYAKLGFLTNDSYLEAVLPAYIRLKPLMPWYMDPFSTSDLQRHQFAAVRALGLNDWEQYQQVCGRALAKEVSGLVLTLRSERIVFVMNRHRPIPATVRSGHRSLLINSDFEVLVPVK